MIAGHQEVERRAKARNKGKRDRKKKDKSAAKLSREDIFVFTCMSTFVGVANSLQIPFLKHGAIVDSGTSDHFCPDKSKFANLRQLEGQTIHTMHDGTIPVCGVGDVAIELSNGSGVTKCLLKDAIYAPEITFTLISVSRLDQANCSTIFEGCQCVIRSQWE